MMAKVFPSTHPRKAQPTKFKEKYFSGEKKHTIRGNYELWAKRAKEVNEGKAYISLRQWEGKPYNSPQIEIDKLYKIGVEEIELEVPSVFSGYLQDDGDYKELAKNDGLSIVDFLEWFFPNPKEVYTFKGVILHFTDLRYFSD